ncbi:MAG: hypothetical protein HOQ20_06150 [Bradyrhizobium sp.]|nr:hypothetical protein [Bradyrhizobium sp.]
MRLTVCLTAVATLCTWPIQATAHPGHGTEAAKFQLNETTWTFIDPEHKVKAIESIDANGNYIENAVSGKHLDHGTAVMKDGKACFTSAMNKDGEMCWTTHPTKIGHSMKTTSDKGKKLTVTRVAYKPMSMPK